MFIRLLVTLLFRLPIMILALLVTLLISTMLVLQQSEYARIQLVQTLANVANTLTGQDIVLRGIASNHLGHWTIEQITWRNQNTALHIQALVVDWQWQHLYSHGLVLRRLAASEVRLSSPPQDNALQLPNLVDTWQALPRLAIESLALNLDLNGQQLAINGQLASHQPTHSAQGTLNLAFAEQSATVQLYSLDGEQFWLQGSVAGQQPVSVQTWLRPRGDWQLAITELRSDWQDHALSFTGGITLAINLAQVQIRGGKLTVNDQPVALEGYLGELDSRLFIKGNEVPLTLTRQWLPQLTGQLSLNGYLVNGWQQPAFEGYIDVFGHLFEQPLDLYSQTKVTGQKIQIDTASARWGDSLVALSGSYQIDQQTLDAQLTWQDVAEHQWRYWVPDWPANLTLTTSGSLHWQGPLSNLSAAGSANAFGRFQDTPLRIELNQTELNLRQITLNDAIILSGQNRLPVTGVINWQQNQLDLNSIGLTIDDALVRQFTELPSSLAFALTGNLAAQGPLSRPEVIAQLSAVGELAQTPLRANVTARTSDWQQINVERLQLSPATGQAIMSGHVTLTPLSAEMTGQFEQFNLAIAKPYLSTPFAISNPVVDGQIQASVSTSKISGTSDLRLTAQLSEQSASLDWQVQGSWPGDSSHGLAITLGDMQATASGRLVDGKINAQGQWQQLTPDVLRQFDLPVPSEIQGALAGQAQLTGPLANPRLTLNAQGSGMLSNYELPWSLNLAGWASANDWRLERGEVTMAEQGYLSAQGFANASGVQLDARIELSDTSYWLGADSQLAGALAGDVTIAGSRQQPAVNGWLNWQSSLYPIAINSAVVTQNNHHQLAIELVDEQAQRLQLDFATPVQALDTWQDNWLAQSFTSNVYINSTSSVLAPLLRDRPEQDFQGELGARIQLSGTFANPSWQGQASINNGYYANAEYGTVLQAIDLALTATERGVDVSAKARDDNGGALTLTGQINWPDEQDLWWQPHLDIKLSSNAARLVRRTDIDATASGQLNIVGPWRDLLVAGELAISPLTIRLVETADAGAALNIVEQVELDNADPVSNSQFAPAGSWQVSATANQRAQLYMLGLQAQLRGDVQLTDDLLAPQVGGRFSIVRGNYTAFGKIFDITRGEVQVQGSRIRLDITARYTGPNINVDLRITGNQDRIELALSSDDGERSSDEILTELLFGKRLEALSPLEAVQLAAAANSLRSTSQELGLFGNTRDFFGLDALTVNSSINNANQAAVSLQAGKYLSNQIYIQVESVVGSETTTTGSLQWQLTPNSNIELYTGEQSRSGGIQFQWQRDY